MGKMSMRRHRGSVNAHILLKSNMVIEDCENVTTFGCSGFSSGAVFTGCNSKSG